MSYLAAALAVLESTGRPMTTREITDEALRRSLITPIGKTPEATMSARLYVHVRDRPNGRLVEYEAYPEMAIPYVHVRDRPNGRLVRLAEQGTRRARRGSVRWAIRSGGVD